MLVGLKGMSEKYNKGGTLWLVLLLFSVDPVRDWDGVSAQWGENIPRLCLVVLVERCSQDSGQTSFLIFSKAGQMERKQSYDSPAIRFLLF